MHRAWDTCINIDTIIILLVKCRAYLGCLLAVTWGLASSHRGDRPVGYGRPCVLGWQALAVPRAMSKLPAAPAGWALTCCLSRCWWKDSKIASPESEGNVEFELSSKPVPVLTSCQSGLRRGPRSRCVLCEGQFGKCRLRWLLPLDAVPFAI